MDDNAIDRLFSGDLNRLIELPKRLVRLFISSTFTDMTLERNSLMERVYPRLKKYCREKHGLDFQGKSFRFINSLSGELLYTNVKLVVDMRWGVRDEATDDHQTSTLCSREIDNCQRMSLGPNFVALLGDKYGFRPLCNRIKSTEYRALRRCLIELDINTDFLDTWYKEDLNAVPAEYLLQPISSILKNFTNKNEPELQAVDQRIWQAIQERLHELLMIGSNRLVKQGRMSQEEQLIKYSISVTEREVIEGCLDVHEAKSQCLVFVRSIQDLQMHLNKCLSGLSFAGGNSPQRLDSSSTTYSFDSRPGSPIGAGGGERRDSQARKASLKIGDDSISLTTSLAQTSTERRIERSRKLIGKYIDLVSKDNIWRVDEEAQMALVNLKEVKLENKLKRSRGKNLIKFRILWNENDGISLKSEEHKQYLNELTEHFLNNMTRMIRKSSKSQQQLKSGLVGEILQHSHYANHVSKTFQGRSEELDKIRAYVLSRDDDDEDVFGSESDVEEEEDGRLEQPQSCKGMPMFIYGVVGSGKTSIMAKAATLARDWISSARAKRRSPATSLLVEQPDSWDRKPCIIMRFCCTTPSSSSMVGVLTSVCRQLQYNFYQYGPLNGQNNSTTFDQSIPEIGNSTTNEANKQLAFQPIPEDYVRLVFTFRQLLENCQHELHKRRLFLILLDSVERLSSPAESGVELKYSWLTSIVRLPANVRLIISCSSERTSESWADDYIHLKRHFLRLYFGQFRAQNEQKMNDISSSNQSRRDSSIERQQQQQPRVVSKEVGSRKESNNKPGDHRESYEKIDEKYRYLKRILIPTVKFKRALNKQENEPSNTNLEKSPEAGRGQSRWSLTSKRLESFARQVSSNSGNKSDLELDDRRLDRAYNLNNVWILHIRPLGVKLAVKVLQRWLAQAGRNLTSQQWTIVESSFEHCSRPIFVKLAFGEIINWKSYSMQSDSRGLTFGSSLIGNLEDNDNKALILTGSKDFDDHLIKLMAESETGQKIAGLGFDNEILNMEQQWNNFLEFKERKKQQQAISNQEASENSQEISQVVIRVGAGTGTGSERAPGSGAANSSLSGSICHLSSTIEDAICQLFARIELQHGYILIKHSLSYITAARNGICENELEDILSLDDVVLDDVFQYHLPPVRRIPPLLWTRIRNDLPDYLSERDADGIVVNWHHGQFKQVVHKRYLSDPKQLFYIHSLLADYFLGKWADKAKPFRCTKQQIQLAADQLESAVQQSIRDSQAFSGANQAKPRTSISGGPGRLTGGSTGGRGASFSVRSRLRSSDQHDARLQWMQAKADRRVPQQPLYYLDNNKTNNSSGLANPDATVKLNNNNRRRFNMRKLTELPYHLLRAGRYLDFAQHILFNYNWLSAALAATGLQNLLADFKEAIGVLEGALELAASRRRQSGAAEATSGEQHLQQDAAISTADELDERTLRAMISQLNILNNTIRLSCSAIHSDTQMLAPQLIGRLLPIVKQGRQGAGRGSPSLGSSSRQEDDLDTKYLGQLLEQCDKDGCADIALLPTDHCLQSPEGLQLSSLEGHAFAIMAMRMAADQRHLLAISNRFIMWDISTGEISRDIDPKIGASIMRQLAMGSNNDYAIAYTSDNVVLVLDILTQQVSKFLGLTSGFKVPPYEVGPLIGLQLVDKITASSFVVWSRSRWFLLRVVNNELTNLPATSGSRLTIELCSSMDLRAELEDDSFGQIINVQVEPESSLAFVETTCNGGKVQLLTFELAKTNPAEKSGLWAQRIEAASMVLHSDNLSQLVFANQTGNVYLCRRRKRGWSRAKLLSLGSRDLQSGSNFANQLNSMLKSSNESPRQTGSGAKVIFPMAIELDSHRQSSSSMRSGGGGATGNSGENIIELSNFERVIDALRSTDEIQANAVFKTTEAIQSNKILSTLIHRKRLAENAIKFVRLYLSNKIVIITISGELANNNDNGYKVSTLLFPKNIRNISVEPNRCQISSILVSQPDGAGELFLVAATGRRILIYNVHSEQFLRGIEAHQARIVQLMPVFGVDKIKIDNNNNNKADDKRQLVFASASMDRTVKIWNLLNVDKEVHSLDKMASSIESICINQQRPIAACLARGELALWDWRTLELITRIGPSDLIADGEELEEASGKIVKCCFSSNGRFLSVASEGFISLLALEIKQASGRSHERISAGQLTFKCAFRRSFFPKTTTTTTTRGLARKISFLQQDSRVLTFLECHSGSHLARKLLLLCHSVPDGRLVYAIDSSTPLMSPSAGLAEPAARRRSEAGLAAAMEHSLTGREVENGSCKIRLPVLTRDKLHIVIVESCFQEEQLPQQNEKLDRFGRQPATSGLALNVYSARDGLLLRSINLGQLEFYSAGPPPAAGKVRAGSPPLLSLALQATGRGSGDSFAEQVAKATTKSPPPPSQPTTANNGQGNNWPICILPEQFSRLKPVSYRERQSVVALLDDEKGFSFLIDVKTKQLLAQASAWNGKTSTDGRFGLSRMFKSSTSALKAGSLGLIKEANGKNRRRDVITTAGDASNLNSPPTNSNQTNNNNGLQLLEMRHFSPVKSLLSNETLSNLSSSWLSQATSGCAPAAGNDTDVTCGFTRANDSYVYYYDNRLSRLLLIRVRDGQLVANYKLSSSLTKIKCSPDGYALLLGLADGSLTSLAIVDPEKNDTLLQLAQYPSRARP